MTEPKPKPLPAWKTVACPYCGSAAGAPCYRLHSVGEWLVKVAPHAARKRGASTPPGEGE